MSYKIIPNSKRKRSQKAFSLIELLLVISLVALVSIAIYTSLSNGIRLWQRMSRSVLEEDLNVFLDRMSTDFRNGFFYKDLPFFGQKTQCNFPSIVTSVQFPQKTVGQISYAYDDRGKALVRSVRDYSEIYLGHEGSQTHTLENVHMLVFLYYVYDSIEEKYLWLDHWEGQELPLAVRIMFAFGEGHHVREYSKTISFFPNA